MLMDILKTKERVINRLICFLLLLFELIVKRKINFRQQTKNFLSTNIK